MEHAGDTHLFAQMVSSLEGGGQCRGISEKAERRRGGCGCVGAVPSVPPGPSVPSVPSVPSPGTAEAHKAAESVHFVKEFIRCRVDQPKLGDVKEKPRFGKTMELLENMVGYTHTGTLV